MSIVGLALDTLGASTKGENNKAIMLRMIIIISPKIIPLGGAANFYPTSIVEMWINTRIIVQILRKEGTEFLKSLMF